MPLSVSGFGAWHCRHVSTPVSEVGVISVPSGAMFGCISVPLLAITRSWASYESVYLPSSGSIKTWQEGHPRLGSTAISIGICNCSASFSVSCSSTTPDISSDVTPGPSGPVGPCSPGGPWGPSGPCGPGLMNPYPRATTAITRAAKAIVLGSSPLMTNPPRKFPLCQL